jgi:hypothetical protein
MLRKVVIGLLVALATATGSVAMAAPAQAEALDRVLGAARAGVEGDVRAARDLAHGHVERAARDAVFGAKLGVLILTGRGGGFGNK